MAQAVRQIETVTQAQATPEVELETGVDAESRLLAELQVQREIVENYRKENRRLTMLLQYKTMKNDDLTRELGMLNAHIRNLPQGPAPLRPCRSATLDNLDSGRMQELHQAIQDGHDRIEGPAMAALGAPGDLLVQAIRREDPVAAMQFQMIMSDGDPDLWTTEGSPSEIAAAAVALWIEHQAPAVDPEPSF